MSRRSKTGFAMTEMEMKGDVVMAFIPKTCNMSVVAPPLKFTFGWSRSVDIDTGGC